MVWARLALPVALILVHFVVSILALVSLAAIERILRSSDSRRTIPGFSTTLGQWISYLEIVAASAIIIAGAVEALVVLFLGIILIVFEPEIREIASAWRS